jgi:hypothetical protein
MRLVFLYDHACMESIVGIGCAGDITSVANCFIIVATFPRPITNDDIICK